MASPLPDAAFLCPEGQDVTGPPEVFDLGVGVGEGAAGQGAVVGGYAGGHGRVSSVDRNGVCGAAGILGVGDHLGEG